jgi:DNA polymerase
MSLAKLAEAAAQCEGCDLHRNATQTVFGKGLASARLVFVGEAPGDQEDRQGEPFVGPAGRLLDEHLAQAGIDRTQAYVTNTVKHFKWEPRGARRLHKKPVAREVSACRPWLEAELEVIAPRVMVCLGATAAQALIGRDFRNAKQRGEFLSTRWCEATIATSRGSRGSRPAGVHRRRGEPAAGAARRSARDRPR